MNNDAAAEARYLRAEQVRRERFAAASAAVRLDPADTRTAREVRADDQADRRFAR